MFLMLMGTQAKGDVLEGPLGKLCFPRMLPPPSELVGFLRRAGSGCLHPLAQGRTPLSPAQQEGNRRDMTKGLGQAPLRPPPS